MKFKPFLLDAYLRWFGECGVTPLLGVAITPECQLPRHLMDQADVWLNVHPETVRQFEISERGVFFQTRFSQVIHEVFLPWDNIQMIQAREWGFAAQLPDLAPPSESKNDPSSQKVLNLRGRDSLSPEVKTTTEKVEEAKKTKPSFTLVAHNSSVKNEEKQRSRAHLSLVK